MYVLNHHIVPLLVFITFFTYYFENVLYPFVCLYLTKFEKKTYTKNAFVFIKIKKYRCTLMKEYYLIGDVL